MNLQTILYGTFTPPPIMESRIHLVGITGGQRYEPPKGYRVKAIADRQHKLRDTIVPWLRDNPGSTTEQIAAGTGLNLKSITTRMIVFVKEGHVTRTGRARKEGGRPIYTYWVKE
jgi:hypothetical protein